MQTIVFDFDGTLAESRPEDPVAEKPMDFPPVPGIREAIADLSKDYIVGICSPRCRTQDGMAGIQAWLSRWGFSGISFAVAEKPEANVYVGSRGITFDGSAETLPERVRHFQSWTEKPVPPVPGMRRCKGGKASGKVTGWFHRWVQVGETRGNGHSYTYTAAIIEADNGTVGEYPIWTVQFLDR